MKKIGLLAILTLIGFASFSSPVTAETVRITPTAVDMPRYEQSGYMMHPYMHKRHMMNDEYGYGYCCR